MSRGTRPLTAAFLSLIFAMAGKGYFAAMLLQGAALLAALLGSYCICRSFENRWFLILFFALLTFWRPLLYSHFLSEVPGVITLMLSFALLLRAVQSGDRGTLLSGMFLFGLHQAIRRWNVLSLPLLTLLAFRFEPDFRRGLRAWSALALAGVMGVAFQPAASWLLNGPGELSGNFHKVLYGRVTGSSWANYYTDPAIMDAYDEELPPRQLRNVVYARIIAKFKASPLQILKSSAMALRNYFVKFHHSFGGSLWKALFTLAMVLALNRLLPLTDKRNTVSKLRIDVLSLSPTLRAIAVAVSIILFYEISLTIAFAVGAYLLSKHPRSRLTWLFALYFAGVLLSLSLVGNDGGLRIQIGSDIAVYAVAALGVAWLVWGENFPESPPKRPGECRGAFAFVAASAVLLLLTPSLFRLIAPGSQPAIELSKKLPAELNLKETLVNLHEINQAYRILMLGKPSVERYNHRVAALPVRFNMRDTVFQEAGEPCRWRKPYHLARFWPLVTKPEASITLMRVNRITSLSGFDPHQLAELEDRKILAVGRVIAPPRRRFYWGTAMMLQAHHLLWRTDDGVIRVIHRQEDNMEE